MPRFSDLPESSSRSNEYQRALGVAAEEAYRHRQPLLALLRIRQIHDYRKARPELKSYFQDKWHAIIHARDPDSAFDLDWHRRAYREAARDLFRRLARDYDLQDTQWTAKARRDPSSEEPDASAFDTLMDSFSDLDAQVQQPESSDVSNQQLRRELARLTRAAEALAHPLKASQQRMLALYPATIRLGLENHAGASAMPTDGEAVPTSTLSEALRSPSADQDLAIEYANRVAVRALNQLDFDEAWAQLAELQEAFLNQTAWRSEVLGALLGTLGQSYGFLACRDNDPSQLKEAESSFVAASGHFEDAPALLRQGVYRLHTAIWRLQLAADDDARELARLPLQAQLKEISDALSSDDSGRLDYAIAAVLKAHHALGTKPWAALRNRIHRVLKPHAMEPALVLQSPMAHGTLLACGWLLAVDGPRRTPRWAVGLVDHIASEPGLFAMLARCFQLEAGTIEPPEPVHWVLELLKEADRERWSVLLTRADSPASLLWRVPFNMA